MATQPQNKNLPVSVDQAAGEYLKKFEGAIEGYAMRDYNRTAFLKSAMIAITSSNDLAECLRTDAGRVSLFHALRYAASTGLSLNPQEGKAALIPYGGKIQYQVMKNGLVELALASSKVEFLTSDYVRKNDKFAISKSSSGDSYEFSPALDDRGALRGFFAVLKFKNGVTHVKYMTADEVDEHRKKFSASTKMPEIGYGVKTVLKSLLRSVQISPDVDNAIGADDFFEGDFTTIPGTTADEAAKKLGDAQKPVEPAADAGSLL